MKKRILFVGIISFISVTLHQMVAAPAVPWLVEKQQPDGTKILVYIKGDEQVNWMESSDGYTLMYDAGKNIVYAEQDSDGNLIPSRVKYKSSEQAPASFKKGLRHSNSHVTKRKQRWETTRPSRLKSAQQQSSPLQISQPLWQQQSSQLQLAPLQLAPQQPVTGAKKALCVLMDFPDKPFSKTQAEFNNLMNQVGYSAGTAQGSVK